jgi:photosystem II stability/assembly factor-like uncharacterized protein
MRAQVAIASSMIALGACGSSSPSSGLTDGGGSTADAADAGPRSDASGGDDSSSGPHDGGAVDYDQVAPTPAAAWANVTNNLTGLPSECGNTSVVFADPRADRLIVGIALDGLFATIDGAMSWKSLGTTGDAIKNRMSEILFDPTKAGTFWESGIYGFETSTPGVYATTDDGASFTGYKALMSLSGAADTNDSVSVDFTDPARKTMLAGTHEGTGQLFRSTDQGATWTNIGPNLPAGIGFCTSALVLDASTFVVGCANSYSGQAGGIVRSTDAGQSFTTVSPTVVIGLPLWASDGTIYFAIEGGGVTKSTDRGATWTTVADANTAGTVPPIELPDGRVVSARQQDVVITADKGASWKTIGPPVPYPPRGLAYSPFRRAFYASYFTCSGSNAVPADAIVRSGWDYEAQDAGP